jgi:hypothetical protein
MFLHFRNYQPVIAVAITVFLCTSPHTALTQCTNNSLTTSFSANNGSRGVMFDITAGATTVTLTSFDGNLFPGGNRQFEIYYKSGTYVGSESTATDWTLGGSAAVTSNGSNVPTPLPIPLSITIPAGATYGFYITNSDGTSGVNYISSASAATLATNSDISISGGVGKNYPFGNTFTFRHANIIAHYYFGSISESMQLATANATSAVTTQSISASTLYAASCDALIAKVTGTGAGSASGNTVARVWIEGTQPTQFVKRHYQISPNANGKGRVTLYFTDAEFNSFNTQPTPPPLLLPLSTDAPATRTSRIANIRVERRPGSSNDNTGLPNTYTTGTSETIDPNDADVVWNATQSRWEVTFNVTGFSGFFLKTTGVILPQQLLHFSGDAVDGGTHLQWQTTGEINWQTFVVERSTDGIHFTAAGSIKPITNTDRYSFTDLYTVTRKIYYRLKMVTADNQIAYSNQLTFNANNGGLYLHTYPNPVRGNGLITISSNIATGSDVRFTDLQGRTLLTIRLNHTSETTDISRFPPGLYLLQADNGPTQKIIKQ